MTIPMMQHRVTTLQNLDMERINDNLERGSSDVQHNLDRRYTYSSLSFPLDGVSTAGDVVLRSVAIRRPGTNNAVEVCAVEISIYTASTAVHTVTCSDTSWPRLEVFGSGDATVEAFASHNIPVAIPSSASDVVFTLNPGDITAITAGRLILHLRCDRGEQGAPHAGYTPILIDSASSTAGSLLDTELANLATAVTTDAANEKDLRATLFAVRNLASGSTVTAHLPSGAVRTMGLTGYMVQAVGGTTTFAETTSANSVAVVGTGPTARAVGSSSTVFTYADAPMTAASDAVATIAASGGQTALLAYQIIWFS